MDNRLERNVNKLLDRYKKTSQQIDQIMQQEPTTQGVSYFNRQPRHSKVIDDEDSSSRERKRRQSGSIEQISRLRETITAKELQEREKYERLRILNKELKMTLKEYIQQNKELEGKLQHREKHTKQYELEIKTMQDLIAQQNVQIKENKGKQDTTEKLIEELQQANHVARTKLTNKKQKIATLKESLKQQEVQYDEQGQSFGKELERVQRLCEDFSQEIKNQEQQNQGLEQEVIKLRDDVIQRDDQIRYFDQLMQDVRYRDSDNQQQIDYLNQQINYQKSQCEQHIYKYEEVQQQYSKLMQSQSNVTSTFEQEVNKVSNQYKDILDKKKQKVNELRNAVDGLTKQNNDLQRLLDIEEKNNQIKEMEILKYQQINQELKQTIDQYSNKLLANEDKIQNILLDLQDNKQLISIQCKKLEEYDSSARLDYRTIESLRDHNQNLQDSLMQLQHFSSDLENQIKTLKYDQSKSMDEIEGKIDELLNSLHISREECKELKIKEAEFKQKLKQAEDEIGKVNVKLQKHKQQTEQLQQSLRQAEDRLRVYDSERQNQQRQVLLDREMSQNTQHKLKVLDDIHSMIKQHKKL